MSYDIPEFYLFVISASTPWQTWQGRPLDHIRDAQFNKFALEKLNIPTPFFFNCNLSADRITVLAKNATPVQVKLKQILQYLIVLCNSVNQGKSATSYSSQTFWQEYLTHAHKLFYRGNYGPLFHLSSFTT